MYYIQNYQSLPWHNGSSLGYQRALVLANDTDVFVLLLHYMDEFENCGIKEVWMKYGTGISQRFIRTHSLYYKLEKSVINSLLKLHIFTGCDVTSKVRTKSAAIKASQVVNLWKFCSFESEEYGFKDAERYLVKVYMENQLVQRSMSSGKLLFVALFPINHISSLQQVTKK